VTYDTKVIPFQLNTSHHSTQLISTLACLPIQVMLLHVLGGTISARSLTVAFRFTRSTAIATGTEGNVFCVATALDLVVAAIVSSIHA
jgi:hypothetical protein